MSQPLLAVLLQGGMVGVLLLLLLLLPLCLLLSLQLQLQALAPQLLLLGPRHPHTQQLQRRPRWVPQPLCCCCSDLFLLLRLLLGFVQQLQQHLLAQ